MWQSVTWINDVNSLKLNAKILGFWDPK